MRISERLTEKRMMSQGKRVMSGGQPEVKADRRTVPHVRMTDYSDCKNQ